MKTLKVTEEEFSYISSAVNNQALQYKEWAMDEIEDQELFMDYIGTYREYMLLKDKLERIAK